MKLNVPYKRSCLDKILGLVLMLIYAELCGCQLCFGMHIAFVFLCFDINCECTHFVCVCVCSVCVRGFSLAFCVALCLMAAFAAEACLHTDSHCNSSVEQISLFVLFASLISIVSVCYLWQCLCYQRCVEEGASVSLLCGWKKQQQWFWRHWNVVALLRVQQSTVITI